MFFFVIGCTSIDTKQKESESISFKLFEQFPHSPILNLNPNNKVKDIKQSLVKFNCIETSSHLYENQTDSFAVYLPENEHLTNFIVYLKGQLYLKNTNYFLNFLTSQCDEIIGDSIFSELYFFHYNFKLTYLKCQNVIRLHYFYGSEAFK